MQVASSTRRRQWQGEGVGRVHIKQGGDCCDTELKLVMQPITACAGRCGHAVASVGAVRAPSRDSYRRCALFVEFIECWLYTSCCCEFGVRSALVYDIVRYIGAAIIAGLPHPRSTSRYRLIDENPNCGLI